MPTATDRNSKKVSDGSYFSSSQKQSLRRRLLSWYAKHARNLPWRQSRDPYRVWVSEIMLQQTQVATVCDYFTRFVAEFPTVHELATADEQHVLRLWEGLGYYRRARQLHAAAKMVVAEYEGSLPQTVDELRELPGIGRYTAGAIASIAFDQRAPILEANTIRLFSRLIGYRDDPLSTTGQRVLWNVAEEILPRKDAARFNQALMELGSLVCTPIDPKCERCPLSCVCKARALGLQSKIPPAKAPKAYTEVREAAVIVRRNGRVLMRQCAANERWAGLWDFPRFKVEAEGPLFAHKEILSKLQEQTGITCGSPTFVKTMRHGVTRFRIQLDCFRADYVADSALKEKAAIVRWVSPSDFAAIPLSTTGRRLALIAVENTTDRSGPASRRG
jgi:A/G-specific adenine glycosylase